MIGEALIVSGGLVIIFGVFLLVKSQKNLQIYAATPVVTASETAVHHPVPDQTLPSTHQLVESADKAGIENPISVGLSESEKKIEIILPEKAEGPTLITPQTAKDQLLQNSKTHDLKTLIKLAAVDGVLTNSEREILLNKCIELGIDVNEMEAALNNQLELRKHNPETKLIDQEKEKGDAFETYIVQKLDTRWFSVIDWTSDKSSDQVYALSSKNPDLRLRFSLKNTVQDFAVECKYRSKFFRNGIEWAKDYQVRNYREYAETQQIPVFVAIGVGGVPSDPQDLFIIPLTEIADSFLPLQFLIKYQKKNKKERLFFDVQQLKLT